MFFSSRSKTAEQSEETQSHEAQATEPPREASTYPETNGRAVHAGRAEASDMIVDVAALEQPLEKPVALSSDELHAHAANAQRTLAQFGSVVSVFMRSQASRNLTLAQIDNLVVPGVVSGQYLVAEAQSRTNGMVAPMAAILYARVSDDVDNRLMSSLDRPVELTPGDWRSGETPWLIAAAGNRRLIGGMIKKVQSDVLGGRQFKVRTRGEDGNTTIKTIPDI